MMVQFNEASRAEIDKILPRYPNKMAACLPLLYVAQGQFGHLDQGAMDLVAETLELPRSHVYGVATFYTMYNRREVGKYHVQACTNVSCLLCGAHDVMVRLEKKLGIRRGETTDDGLFTLTEVECLAHCGSGPAVQINEEIRELVTPETVDEIIDTLKARG